jgi:hypothetical protein
MAAMHTTFFNDPQLLNRYLNLCTLAHTYTVFGPQTAERETNGYDEVPKTNKRRVGVGAGGVTR